MSERLAADDLLLLEMLRRDEGLRLTAYPDPLTKADPWTIGYGHTGPEVRRGVVWLKPQAEAALKADVAEKMEELDVALPWWRKMSLNRQRALASMAFNMGLAGLLKFKNTLAAMEGARYGSAAAGMRLSLWRKQVGQRAERLALLMDLG